LSVLGLKNFAKKPIKFLCSGCSKVTIGDACPFIAKKELTRLFMLKKQKVGCLSGRAMKETVAAPSEA
jgi:hypothetical protein